MKTHYKTKTVLVIDDNPHIRLNLRALFESDGFRTCVEAANGKDGIRLEREHSPDLIILDMAMPGMTGIQVAPILQKLFPATPVILFTLHGDTFKNTDLRPIGIWEVFSKSDSLDNLLGRAHELVGTDHREVQGRIIQ